MTTFYNPMDIDETQKAMDYMESEGFQVSLQNRQITLKRETSKYNKYMKWHVEMVVDGHCVSSEYFKTKPAAYRDLSKPKQPIPIGNQFYFHLNTVMEI